MRPYLRLPLPLHCRRRRGVAHEHGNLLPLLHLHAWGRRRAMGRVRGVLRVQEPVHHCGHLHKARPFLGIITGWSLALPLVEVAGVARQLHAGMEAVPLVGSCSALGSGAARLVGMVNLHVILTPSYYPSLPFPPPFTPPHPGRAPVALYGWPVDDPLAAGASRPTAVGRLLLGRSLFCRWLSSRWQSLTCGCFPLFSSWTARCHPINLPPIQALAVGCVKLVWEP
uniref:Uncharacterized protein n=1 Tax=Setaria viridis TaxID=4556 RepID=A0A4U6W817_SETVI|nr:hypothetical protein SEVIR_1G140100v2 [Setaria viridis]